MAAANIYTKIFLTIFKLKKSFKTLTMCIKTQWCLKNCSVLFKTKVDCFSARRLFFRFYGQTLEIRHFELKHWVTLRRTMASESQNNKGQLNLHCTFWAPLFCTHCKLFWAGESHLIYIVVLTGTSWPCLIVKWALNDLKLHRLTHVTFQCILCDEVNYF